MFLAALAACAGRDSKLERDLGYEDGQSIVGEYLADLRLVNCLVGPGGLSRGTREQ